MVDEIAAYTRQIECDRHPGTLQLRGRPDSRMQQNPW